MIKLATYNVNGIRAAEKKGFSQWLQQENPDVVCIQEIKALAEEIPDYRFLGYEVIAHPARKRGYSGVAMLSKTVPQQVQLGSGYDWIDGEGRILMAEFESVRVFSVYFPSGTSGEERQQFKYQFLDAFWSFSRRWVNDPKPTIFAGDINIAHEEIDIHDPVGNKNNSGFLPQERAWMSRFLTGGYHDLFRQFVGPKPDLYSWWTYRAGAKGNNKGWRIDYMLGNGATRDLVCEAKIVNRLDLSDHAPVVVTLSVDSL